MKQAFTDQSYCRYGYVIMSPGGEETHSRLRGPSDAEAHQGAEEQDPAVDGGEGAHQPVEHGPQHTHLQTL